MASPTIAHIDTWSDPRLAGYRAVSEPQLARREGVFVAEGRLVVSRVLADRRYVVRSLLLNESSYRALEGQLASRPESTPVYVVETGLFKDITGFNIHRGCVALVERPPARSIAEVVGDARLLVVLEDVTNADNVGGVFRNALAFGADGVLLSPACCDPLYRKAIRTSMGACLTVPFTFAPAWPQEIDGLRSMFTVLALTPEFGAMSLDERLAQGRSDRVALLLGTEGPGLSAAVMKLADARVRIPMAPGVDSLNLAVAAGIALSRLASDSRF